MDAEIIDKLLTKDMRDREAKAIFKGDISKGKQIYASDSAVKHIKERRVSYIEYAKDQVMVSEEGDSLNMLDVMAASLANPKNRRAEMMVRAAGFEQFADDLGHAAMFYTLTCPSRFHRYTGGKLNKNYDSSTPKQAQKYLTDLWALIRTKFHDNGLDIYGFRVAEPHGDGTPHWHMLLFMPPGQEPRITAIIQEYALRENKDEPGAAKYRFIAKEILKEIKQADGTIKKVSATGYIAKYISKNIGFELDADKSEEPVIGLLGERVLTWASVWGIRQFQQIGGASVSVWRELRRLKDADIEDEVMRDARDCCVINDWSGFLKIMGGIDIKRLAAKIQLLKKCDVDESTGVAKLNKYQEIVWRVIGISTALTDAITHTKKWVIQPKPVDYSFDEEAILNLKKDDAEEVRRQGGRTEVPWSSINNCRFLDGELHFLDD